MSNEFGHSLISLGIQEDWYLYRNEQKIKVSFFFSFWILWIKRIELQNIGFFKKKLRTENKVQSIYLFIYYIWNVRIHATASKYFLYNIFSNFRTMLTLSATAKHRSPSVIASTYTFTTQTAKASPPILSKIKHKNNKSYMTQFHSNHDHSTVTPEKLLILNVQPALAWRPNRSPEKKGVNKKGVNQKGVNQKRYSHNKYWNWQGVTR
jgi:hypothetical protein